MVFIVKTTCGDLCFSSENRAEIEALLSGVKQTQDKSYNILNLPKIMEELAYRSESELFDLTNFILKCCPTIGPISSRLHDKIISLITGLDELNVWPSLCAKFDYNSTLFNTRKFPYFACESKAWSAAVLNANDTTAEYQSDLTGVVKQKAIPVPDSLSGFSDEEIMTISLKNNNYAAYDRIMTPSQLDIGAIVYTLVVARDIPAAVYLINYCMRSYKFFHIITSQPFWLLVTQYNLFSLIKNSLWYAMYLMKQDETIMGDNITLADRVVFNIKAAAAIPNASYEMENMPYVIHICSTKIDRQIFYYLPCHRGINQEDEFKRRFNIATGNALLGIPLKKYGAAITGSILVPCAHHSTLEEGFDTEYKTDTPHKYVDKFDRYLEYFYPSYRSLTDQEYKEMCKLPEEKAADVILSATQPATSGNTSISNVIVEKELINEVIDELEPLDLDDFVQQSAAPEPPAPIHRVQSDFGTYDEPSELEVTQPIVPVMPAALVTNNEPDPNFNQLTDIDISITTKRFDLFKKRVQLIYEAVKKNCESRGPVYLAINRRIASTAFKMYGPGLIRPIDIFMINYAPIKMVKKFHLPCVKMYYDNENLYMLSSCVAALNSGINHNYKWFSCNKVAADILIKYANRGITTILNEGELRAMTEYIRISKRWTPLQGRPLIGAVPNSDVFFTTEIGCRRGLIELKRNIKPTTSRLSIATNPSLYHYGKHVIAPPTLNP
jgi:hypothetical protein